MEGEPVHRTFLNTGSHDELLLEVFIFLDLEFALRSLGAVNKRFRTVAKDNTWKPDLLLYSWGEDVKSGHGEKTKEPRLLQRFYSPRAAAQISNIACTNDGTFAVDGAGRVWHWGTFGDNVVARPELLAGLEKHRILRVEASCPGYYHALHHYGFAVQFHAAALAADGTFLQWGSNIEGQLFLPRPDRNHENLLRQVADTPNFFYFLYNNHQQLAAELDGCTIALPTVSNFFEGKGRIVDFSCGQSMTLVLTEDDVDGDAFSTRRVWEASKFGHLEVEELRGRGVEEVAGGGWYGCAILREDRSLWTWGDPSGPDVANGSLLCRPFHGQDPKYGTAWYVPEKVEGPLGELRVRKVVCSTYSGLAITECGQAFTWGDCDGNSLGHSVQESNVAIRVDVAAAAVGAREGSRPVRVVEGSMCYTNGSLASDDGRVFVFGGSAWEHGIGRTSGSDEGELTEVVGWGGIAEGYACKRLVLGHDHAFIVARKRKLERREHPLLEEKELAEDEVEDEQSAAATSENTQQAYYYSSRSSAY